MENGTANTGMTWLRLARFTCAESGPSARRQRTHTFSIQRRYLMAELHRNNALLLSAGVPAGNWFPRAQHVSGASFLTAAYGTVTINCVLRTRMAPFRPRLCVARLVEPGTLAIVQTVAST